MFFIFSDSKKIMVKNGERQVPVPNNAGAGTKIQVGLDTSVYDTKYHYLLDFFHFSASQSSSNVFISSSLIHI